MSRRTVSDALRRILDDRRDRERDLTDRVVVGRAADGAELHLALDGTCPARTEGANRVGQVVRMPATAPDHRGGLGGGSQGYGGQGVIWIERQDPPELLRGTTQEVTIHGRGLVPGIEIVYQQPAETTAEDPSGIEPHPGVTVDAAAAVDASTYQLTITVAPDARLVTDAPIVWTHRGRPHRRDHFYGVVPNPLTAAFAVYLGREEVTYALYDAAGVWVGDVGTCPANPRVDFCPIWGAGSVSDGSIAWVDTTGTSVRVWDWAAEVLHQVDLEAPWTALAAGWVGGYLWWIEYQLPEGSTMDPVPTRLRRAAPDLGTVVTVGSYDLIGPPFPVTWSVHARPILFSPGYCGLVFYRGGVRIRLRYSYAGGADFAGNNPPGMQRLAIVASDRGLWFAAFAGEDIDQAPYQWDGGENYSLWMPQGWIDYLADKVTWDCFADGIGLSRDLNTIYLANSGWYCVVIGSVTNPGSQPDEMVYFDPHPTLPGGGSNMPIQVWPL